MQTKQKSNSVITTEYEAARGVWIFNVVGLSPVELYRDKLHADILERGLIEGISDRVADKAAKSRDKVTGIAASPAEKRAAMQGIVDYYETGAAAWSMHGEAISGLDSVLLKALKLAYPQKTEKELREFLSGKTKAQQGALAVSDELAEHVVTVRKKLTAGIDTAAVLAGL